MRSTTAEREPEATSRLNTDADVALGLGVMFGLVADRRRPANRREELAALRALGALVRREELPSRTLEIRQLLYAKIEALKEREADALLAWIEKSRGARDRRRITRRTAARHLLLLVLLAKTTASISKFVILPILNRRSLFGTPESVERLLTCLPRLALRQVTEEMSVAYLTTAAAVLFTGEELQPQSPREIGPEAFLRRTWTRQIVELIAWRASWDAYQADIGDTADRMIPTYRGGTIEYRLARCGGFARIRARGGSVARLALARLGYEDHPVARRNRRRRRITSVVAFAAFMAAMAFLALRVVAWDRGNAEMARRLAADRGVIEGLEH